MNECLYVFHTNKLYENYIKLTIFFKKEKLTSLEIVKNYVIPFIRINLIIKNLLIIITHDDSILNNIPYLN